MSTSRLDRLASAAAHELLDTAAAETDTLVRRAELDRVRRNRRGARLTAVAAVTVAVLLVLSVQGNFSSDSDPQPMQPAPGLDIGDVPVWYDDAGLHRGDIVEQTPVELRQEEVGDNTGALALVRTGAVYLDPATEEVWFHPWGGEPRIVGHDSYAGPGGDPSGDIAVWFEGTGGELCCNVHDPELVVYDTAAGREIARKTVSRPTDLPFASLCHSGLICDQPGNGFLQVSAERVVWTPSDGFGPSYIYDARTERVSSVANSKLVDGPDAAVRFSPSGNYVLSDDAAIIDTRTDELWPVPEAKGGSWSAWSYGDIALVDTKDALLACDAASRTCEELPAEGTPLMPTN